MACNCFAERDADARSRGLQLDGQVVRYPHRKLKALQWQVSIHYVKAAGQSTKKGVPPFSMPATHCPFCGRKYDDSTTDTGKTDV